MADMKFKEFSDEEDRIYEEAIGKIRSNMKKGMHIDEACKAVEVADGDLKRIITEDFLKITIAEMHYTSKMPLEAVSKELKIPLDRVQLTHRLMVEEVMHAQAEKTGSLTPEMFGFAPPKGNA